MIKLLDYGYVDLVQVYGSDEDIIRAARMSVDRGFEGWDKDSKLLEYLHRNKHTTPFEMAGAIFEVKLPIFVVREWHRHRTQSYNEMSARYAPLPYETYLPTIERLMMNSDGTNKQAGTIKGALPLTLTAAQNFQNNLTSIYKLCENLYLAALNEGIPKELARIHLPLARYTKMRASANLLNWCKFLTLRCDSKAQWEIQQYANAVKSILSKHFPRTMELHAKS